MSSKDKLLQCLTFLLVFFSLLFSKCDRVEPKNVPKRMVIECNLNSNKFTVYWNYGKVYACIHVCIHTHNKMSHNGRHKERNESQRREYNAAMHALTMLDWNWIDGTVDNGLVCFRAQLIHNFIWFLSWHTCIRWNFGRIKRVHIVVLCCS